jgi:hypothetical protein
VNRQQSSKKQLPVPGGLSGVEATRRERLAPAVRALGREGVILPSLVARQEEVVPLAATSEGVTRGKVGVADPRPGRRDEQAGPTSWGVGRDSVFLPTVVAYLQVIKGHSVHNLVVLFSFLLHLN